MLLRSGWGGLRGGELAALCLPGRYGLQLEGRHLLGAPFGCSLGGYSLHRGGVHVERTKTSAWGNQAYG